MKCDRFTSLSAAIFFLSLLPFAGCKQPAKDKKSPSSLKHHASEIKHIIIQDRPLEKEDIERFKNLRELEGNLIIESVSGMTNLDFLSTIESVSGIIGISENKELLNIEGLSRLKKARSIVILRNPKLVSMNLSSLKEVSDLTIKKNPQLKSLMGLEQLESAHSILIEENHKLTSINELEKVSLSKKGEFTVKNNRDLTPCSLSPYKKRRYLEGKDFNFKSDEGAYCICDYTQKELPRQRPLNEDLFCEKVRLEDKVFFEKIDKKETFFADSYCNPLAKLPYSEPSKLKVSLGKKVLLEKIKVSYDPIVFKEPHVSVFLEFIADNKPLTCKAIYLTGQGQHRTYMPQEDYILEPEGEIAKSGTWQLVVYEIDLADNKGPLTFAKAPMPFISAVTLRDPPW